MESNISNNKLTPDKLDEWINQGRSLYLIHVLPADHFEQAHLPGALQASVYEVSFLDQIKEIVPSKKKTIVVYGASARSSDAVKAAEKLVGDGYAEVFWLDGGIEDWQQAGYPVEGKSPDQLPVSHSCLALSDGIYTVDTELSRLEWAGRNPHTTHFGSLDIVSGILEIKEGTLTGTFELDMTSIANLSLKGDELQPVLDDHLKSDDFFLAEHFPKAIFRIQEGRSVIKPFLSVQNLEVLGELELKGIKANQNFMATLSPGPDGELLAEAHFDLDRTRWGVIYGSSRFFEFLGMHLIFDQISIQVRIVAA